MLREEKERKRAANGSDPGERENHQAIGYGLLVDTKRRHYTDILQFKIGALITTFKKEKRKEKEKRENFVVVCQMVGSGMDQSRFFFF